jgi:hypothetical protein
MKPKRGCRRYASKLDEELKLLKVRLVFIRFRRMEKSDYLLRHICPSVRSHGTILLQLDEFLRHLILGNFSKICQENSSFIYI